jgi:hypothetical protein
VLAGLIHRLVPISDPAGSASGTSPPSDQAISAGRRRWMLLGVVLLMAVVVVALIVWGRPGATNASPVGSFPATTAAVNSADIATQEAAIRATLMGYNAAETEAAALLRIDPLTPYLAPEGPFAVRRAAELAERQRRNAPHRSILVRWGIGAITVNGDTATAVTQETWSNQEAGAVAPEQATVRLTSTLRWDAAAERWLIVEPARWCCDWGVRNPRPFAIMRLDQKAFRVNRQRVWLATLIPVHRLTILSRAILLLG